MPLMTKMYYNYDFECRFGIIYNNTVELARNRYVRIVVFQNCSGAFKFCFFLFKYKKKATLTYSLTATHCKRSDHNNLVIRAMNRCD